MRVFRSNNKAQRDTVCWVDDAVLQHSSDSQLVFSLSCHFKRALEIHRERRNAGPIWTLFFPGEDWTGLEWSGDRSLMWCDPSADWSLHARRVASPSRLQVLLQTEDDCTALQPRNRPYTTRRRRWWARGGTGQA